MNSNLARLQDTLRAIEQGRRLESVDGVLLRQVLGPPAKHSQRERVQPAKLIATGDSDVVVTKEERGDVYRALVELQRQRKKAKNSQQQLKNDQNVAGSSPASPNEVLQDGGGAETVKTSPCKRLPPQHEREAPVNRSKPPSPVRIQRQQPRGDATSNNNTDKHDDLRSVSVAKEAFEAGIARSQQELRASQLQVSSAAARVEQVLAESASILPPSFLFERKLASYCRARAVDAVKRVLLRCQHRFFIAYWRRWTAAVLQLRAVAKKRAVATIARVFRGHQARNLARRLRKQRDKLEAQRLQLVRLRVQYRDAQARRVQRAWKRFRRRKMLLERVRRRDAAKFLQQRFRNRRLRANQLINALVHFKLIRAAIWIQKMERGRQARARVAKMKRQLRREALVAEILARNASSEALVAWKLRRRGAAFLIARDWIYPFAVRRRFRRLAHQLKRLKAARAIARCVRRWWASKQRSERQSRQERGEKGPLAAFDKWLELLPLDKQKGRREAAVLIQKNLRRWVQQGKYLVGKASREKQARKRRLVTKRERMESVEANDAGGSIAGLRRQLSSQPHISSMASMKATVASGANAPRFMRLARSLQPKDKTSGSSSSLTTTSTVAATALLMPEDQASSITQRSYRRHRAQVQVQQLKWRSQASKVEMRVQRRRQSAIRIQSVWRGWTARQLVVTMRAERVLRAYVRRWKLRRSALRTCATICIAKWYHNARGRHLAHIWRLERKRRVDAATTLQRWARHCVWTQRRLPRILAEARRREEASEFGRSSLAICRRHLRESHLARSIKAGLDSAVKKYVAQLHGQSHQSTSLSWRKYRIVDLPVVQLVFVAAATGDAYAPDKWRELAASTSVPSSILQTRLERSKALQFFKNLNRANTTWSSTSPKRSPGKKALMFAPTDVDVCLAKAADASKGALSFAEFVRLLGHMADLKMAPSMSDSTAFSRHDEATSRVLTLLWRFVLADTDAKALLSDFQAQMDAEYDARARCLQRLARRRANLMRATMIRANAAREQHTQRKNAAAVRIQTLLRRILATREYRNRVRETYEKYLDPDWGLPYWLNPRTGYSTWRKPAVLGAQDVNTEPVPYPSAALTLKIACNGKDGCERCAQWLCYDCDEYFCAECLPEFHKNKRKKKADTVSRAGSTASLVVSGNDTSSDGSDAKGGESEHEMEKLALCGLCAFQLASRRYSDCEKPSKTTKSTQPQHLLPEMRTLPATTDDIKKKQALFCDVCFAFMHRRGQLQTHKAAPLLELCRFCVPDDLQQGQNVAAKAGDTMIPNAVQWECDACHHERVCGACAAQSHPTESCGELRRLPLQTLSMVARAERLKAEQDARDSADVDKRRQRAEMARRERFARVIQRFWHNRGPLMRARRVLLAHRQEQSDRWKQLQQDRKRESALIYRAKAVFGAALVLPSDSDVQQRLRGMTALMRRRMRLRARAFGILLHEYMAVGVPLPGVAKLVRGDAEAGEQDELITSEDLRGWVKRRQTLRLVKIPKETKTADKYLCAWTMLAHWGKRRNAEGAENADGVLMDVAAKDATMTERSVVLASAFPTSPKATSKSKDEAKGSDGEEQGSKRKSTKQREDDEAAQEEDDVEFAMFLVEFSMDPKRSVWIDHSLYVALL